MNRPPFIHILLLLILLASSLRTTNAQVDDAPVLARVEWNDATTRDLPIYLRARDADQREYALVFAPVSRLRGVAYHALDADAARASDYVVARERRVGARTDAAQRFDVLYDDGRQIVLRLAFDQTDALTALGFSMRRLDDTPIVWRAAWIPRAPQVVSPDPNVAAMIAQVQASTASDYTARLSGETPVTIGGAAYTIASRYTKSGTPIPKATQYVYERMSALGLTTSYHAWSACGTSNRNVVAEKIGATRPSEIVLITAHLDDLPSGSTAPGADDNASGSVGVWLAAEILRQSQFERTLRFIFFTGEEQGLCGSARYAASVSAQNIVAVYNLDMIAWDAVGSPILRLYTRASSDPGYAGDLAIANTFIGVVNAYSLTGNLAPTLDTDEWGYSDHASFWDRGFAAILAIEDDVNDFNSNYHKASDRLAALNLTYFTNFVKASVGTAAHLALPVSAARKTFLPIIFQSVP